MQPCLHRYGIERSKIFILTGAINRYGECIFTIPALLMPVLIHDREKFTDLLLVIIRNTKMGHNAFLPPAIDIQAFLRIKTEVIVVVDRYTLTVITGNHFTLL